MGVLERLRRTPSRNEFANLFIKAVREAGFGEQLCYDEKLFAVKLGKDDFFYLANAYASYCAAESSEQERVIRKYVSAIPETGPEEIPEHFETGTDNYFPHLRHKAFFSVSDLLLQARGVKGKFNNAFVPFVGDVVIALVYDNPNSVAMISQDRIDRWGKSFDEVLSVAKENLFKATVGNLVQINEGVYISPWKDIYNGTRLLLSHLFERLGIKGNPVAVIPTRETLVVTGSEDTKGLSIVAEISKEAPETGRALSGRPLVFQNGTWADFRLTPDHPTYTQFRMLRLMELARDYSNQKELLEQVEGEDFYVAEFTVTQKKETGELGSYAVWTDGVSALLPEADTVAFVRSKNDIAVYRWENVLKVCGSLMEPCGLFPERYRVRTFPEKAILEKISQVS